MSKLRGIIAVSIFVLLLSVFIGEFAFAAAEAKAPAAAFGTVDIEQAFNGYEKKQQLEQDLMIFYEQIKQRLELQNTNKLLTAEEFSQLADLKSKAKQDEADKKKIEDLLALSRQREQEFQSLQQKQNATDAEKARLKEMQDQIGKTDALIKDDQGKYESELNKRRVDLSRQVMQEVETAVAAAAKEKGLTLVFNKSVGEPGLVVYSNVDITDDVLKKLNKK